MENYIMMIVEVLKYIKLKTAYAIVSCGDILGFKVGGLWQFRKCGIVKWINNQILKREKAWKL